MTKDNLSESDTGSTRRSTGRHRVRTRGPSQGRISRSERLRRSQRNLAIFSAAGTLLGAMAAGIVHFTIIKIAIGAAIGLGAGLAIGLLADSR